MGRWRLLTTFATAALAACVDFGSLSGGDTCSGGSCADGGALGEGGILDDSGTDTTGCNPGFATCVAVGPTKCGVDIAADTQNCGHCGDVCFDNHTASAPSCENSKCVFDCAMGFGNCDGTDSNGCEATLQTDTHNCGACGHDCKGGTCTAGACDSVMLLGDYVFAIALDDTNLYFATETHGIESLSKTAAPGAAATQLVPLSTATETLAASASTLYFENPSTRALESCAKTGCSMTPSNLVSNLNGFLSPLVDTGTVYWVQSLTGTGQIMSASATSSGSAAQLFSNSATTYGGIVTDATNVYFTQYAATQGSVQKCSKTGLCSPSQVAAPENVADVGPIVMDGTSLYWLEVTDVDDPPNPGIIYSCAIAACSRQMVANNSGLSDFVVDSGVLFFAQKNGVFECPVSSCANPMQLSTITNVESVAVDSDNVYFGALGGLYRVPR